MPEKFPTIASGPKGGENKEVESGIEPIKFQEWHSITNLFRKSPNKKDFMDAMKKGGINMNGVNITPMDFFATSPDLSDDEIAEGIEGYLGVENLENKIEAINKALIKSKDYIENYLHMKLPKEIKNLEDARNISDVIKIFKKTAAAKEGDRIGLAPAYCGLLSVAVASFEFEKKEMDGLMKESEYLYEAMFGSEKETESDEESEYKTFYYIKKKKSGYDRIGICNGSEIITGTSYFRGKNEDSLISKFINKPESTAEEAAKDGIGFKFEVKTEDDLEKIVPEITKYFKNNFEAEDFVFENTKLLSADKLDEIKERCEEQLRALGERSLLVKENGNEYSNRNFRSFKVNGSLAVPMKGDIDSMKMRRHFEVQIVLSNNDNESGFSNHFVYEAAKKLSVVTRLFGSFTEDYLDLISDEARTGSTISSEKIKEYLKSNFLQEIKKTKGYSKTRYVSEKNADRFLKSGIFPPEQIEFKALS
jgi:hypothetical protein